MKKQIWVLPLLLLFACSTEQTEEPPEPGLQPAFTEKGVNAIIEIPAGTNRKIEFDAEEGTFKADQLNGQDRVINFLPYPGNYGFIPSTKVSRQEGGDGDALDILVISESLPTGTQIEVQPIALLLLQDEGEADTKVIAIPADSSRQVIDPQDFLDFSIRYDGAKHIIENWFLYYDGLGTNKLEGWGDERAARREVERWLDITSSNK